MISGISLRKIKTRMNKMCVDTGNLRDNQIRYFLNGIGSLQKDSGMPVIFDYDRGHDRVRITDKGFILWRKAQKKDDIQEMILENVQTY